MKNIDLEMKLAALAKSPFRAKFCLKAKDLDYINEKGLEVIRKHANDFISQRLASAFPANDGKQTPFKGHPVFIAQHATATCCRGCLFRWHKIPKGRALNEEEIKYILEIIELWIRKKME